MIAQISLLGGLLACSSARPVFENGKLSRETPTELGQVAFSRDFEASLVRARRESKPVFLLFQEIPGCATCVAFGQGPLSHPLLVEAIEELFVPVAVYNNRGGADRTLLERYSEPAWNNPVVRFLDPDGTDLIERRSGVWSTRAIVARMSAALVAAGQERPTWFMLLASELEDVETASAVFAMPCFWSGEAKLGGLDGVLNTRAGWHAGREVVEVTYDPERLDWQSLLGQARRSGCASTVWVPDAGRASDETHHLEGSVRAAKSSDQLYYLGHSPLRLLPLTPLQARRLNNALAANRPVDTWLSARQRQIARRLEQLDAASTARLADWNRPTDHPGLAQYTRDLEHALGL